MSGSFRELLGATARNLGRTATGVGLWQHDSGTIFHGRALQPALELLVGLGVIGQATSASLRGSADSYRLDPYNMIGSLFCRNDGEIASFLDRSNALTQATLA
jgi:hypothetical protein